jgi:hypothetical protein
VPKCPVAGMTVGIAKFVHCCMCMFVSSGLASNAAARKPLDGWQFRLVLIAGKNKSSYDWHLCSNDDYQRYNFLCLRESTWCAVERLGSALLTHDEFLCVILVTWSNVLHPFFGCHCIKSHTDNILYCCLLLTDECRHQR